MKGLMVKYMKIKKCLLFYIILLFLVPAKGYSLSFGKNRLRVDMHKWYIAETEHYEIYHYKEAKELMTGVGSLAEEAFKHVTDMLNYHPSRKSPMFLYLSQNHFEQNNIANAEGAGGFAEPLKNRFVIPLTGSERRLKHVIYHEFTHEVCFYMWYDDTWKSAGLLKSIFYPLWIVEGVAEYVSAHYDDLSYADMVLRDAVLADLIIPLVDLQNFGTLRSYQVYLAYKESESAIRYIAEKHGKESVGEMIAMYRQSIDVNSVLLRTVKNNLGGFDREWQRYLKEKYAGVVENKEEAEYYGDRLTGDNEYNTNPVFSPDGRKIAFISDRKGYNDIFVMDENGSRQHSLLNSRIGGGLEYVYRSGHALSWSPNGKKIAFAGRKNYKDYICIIGSNGWGLRKIPIPLDCVSSPCYSGNGDKIVFVGMKNGINDIWLLDLEKNEIKQLTDDKYDDDYPVFSPDDSKLVYVSEHNLQKDLYILNLETDELEQLTDTPCYEIHPEWSGDGSEVYFISDPDGYYNLYRKNIIKDETKMISDVITGMFNPAVSKQGDKISYVAYRYGEKNIYIRELSELIAVKPREQESEETQPLKAGEESLAVKTPEDISPVTDIREYRFKPSTDIFIPVGFVDSELGIYALAVWYLSDMLGDHNLALEVGFSNTYYGEWEDSSINRDLMNLRISYIYKGFRPDMGFYYMDNRWVDVNSNYYNDYEKMLSLDYPFSKFSRISIGAGIYNGKEWDKNDDPVSDYDYHVGSVSFVRDTTQGKMLDILSGHRANLTIEKSFTLLGGDYDYSMFQMEAQKYFTVRNYRMHDYHVLALRYWGGVVRGKRLLTMNFNLEDPSMLRGFYNELATGNMFSLFNAELRLMILPELDYHIWYFWPDIYIKNLQMVLFLDSGRTWKTGIDTLHGIEGFNTSVGVGARLNLFILEQFPLVLRLDYAAQLNDFSKNRITLRLGPTF